MVCVRSARSALGLVDAEGDHDLMGACEGPVRRDAGQPGDQSGGRVHVGQAAQQRVPIRREIASGQHPGQFAAKRDVFCGLVVSRRLAPRLGDVSRRLDLAPFLDVRSLRNNPMK